MRASCRFEAVDYAPGESAWERMKLVVASMCMNPAGDVRLPRTLAAIERGVEHGLHVGAQLYVSLGGEIVADMAVGEARWGVAMQTDTLMLWLSAGKPITAVAVSQMK